MNEENLKTYYNKFNEDKRLKTRHGNLEFITTLNYIHKYIKKGSIIADIGAGCGAYSEILKKEGYNIKAVELIKRNVRTIEEKGIDVYQGNAINLNMFENNSFDAVLLLGPIYHLITLEEKIKCLEEAKRILKPNGIIFIAYIMSDFAIIKHGFMEKAILKEQNRIKNFKVISNNTDLYSYVTLEDINNLNKKANLNRITILATTGLSNYIRPFINDLNEEEYNLYIKYHLKNCERLELLGYSSNVLDIVKKD